MYGAVIESAGSPEMAVPHELAALAVAAEATPPASHDITGSLRAGFNPFPTEETEDRP